MPRHFLVHAVSILPMISLAAGLGACTGPVYFAEQLETIPLPGPVMMKSLQDPDCRFQSRIAVVTDKAKQTALFDAVEGAIKAAGQSDNNSF